MQVRALFRDDRPFDGTDLQADTTVDAGGKVDPVPICTFGIFAGTRVDAGNRAGVNAIGNAFAYVGNNCMGHRVLSPKGLESLGWEKSSPI